MTMKVSDVLAFDCGPVTWRVSCSDIMLKEKISSDPDAPAQGLVVAGLTDCIGGHVVINPEQSEDHMRATLWHEAWHAAYDAIGGLRLGSEPTEDEVILQLSSTLLDTLRRNGPFTAALLSGSTASVYIKEQGQDNDLPEHHGQSGAQEQIARNRRRTRRTKNRLE